MAVEVKCSMRYLVVVPMAVAITVQVEFGVLVMVVEVVTGGVAMHEQALLITSGGNLPIAKGIFGLGTIGLLGRTVGSWGNLALAKMATAVAADVEGERTVLQYPINTTIVFYRTKRISQKKMKKDIHYVVLDYRGHSHWIDLHLCHGLHFSHIHCSMSDCMCAGLCSHSGASYERYRGVNCCNSLIHSRYSSRQRVLYEICADSGHDH